jgi:hypothetical protein
MARGKDSGTLIVKRLESTRGSTTPSSIRNRTKAKCEEGEKEGGSTSEGAGSQVEPILMVEIAFSVVGFWKIALAEPLDPLVECVGSFVIGSTNSKRRVIGESVVNVTWEY